MRKLLIITALASLLSAPCYASSVRVCHYPGLSEMGDHRTTDIPKGSSFMQEIAVPGHDPIMGRVVSTTEDAKLPPKPGCVTIPIDGSIKGRVLPQFNTVGVTLSAKAN